MATGPGKFSGKKRAPGAMRRPALAFDTASRPRRHKSVRETTAEALRIRGSMVAHSFVDDRQTETGVFEEAAGPGAQNTIGAVRHEEV
jgi:hypothetical protein